MEVVRRQGTSQATNSIAEYHVFGQIRLAYEKEPHTAEQGNIKAYNRLPSFC